MFRIIMISVLFILAPERTNGGYIYPRPNIQLQLPKIESITSRPITETEESYSVPLQTYLELHQDNSNLITVNTIHESKVNSDLTVPCLENIPSIDIPPLELITPLKNQENNAAPTNGQHLNIPVANIPIYQNNDLISETYSHVNNPSIPTVNVPQPLKEQSNFEFTQQHIVQQNYNGDLNSPINVQKAVSPKIFKHVYFHAPPPEIEEPSVSIVPPKIKNVKIIVIYVPSQENKDIGLSQRNGINQFTPIEEKTIIYVLSKKPTTPQVFVPEPVPSEHEVFFVKYNGSVDSANTQISGNQF